MKIYVLTLSFFIFSSSLFAYENGKIETHGGKGDPLVKSGSFLGKIGLLNKSSKDDEKIKKNDKKFIEIEKIEKIKKEDNKDND
ncbi:hypothetical protein [Halarcobacter sp.]|uniref:hypothetical protein n=1 Tax=Halarcobacter sp. TaxID=2321133 RepID=UPI0029F5A1A0|nr:hypothetical protein [Halarcobacter sp.]